MCHDSYAVCKFLLHSDDWELNCEINFILNDEKIIYKWNRPWNHLSIYGQFTVPVNNIEVMQLAEAMMENGFVLCHYDDLTLVVLNWFFGNIKYIFISQYWDGAARCGLTHWSRVTHICVGNLTIISSDNGLSARQRQAIIWTNDAILLIGPLGTNFSEI